MTSDNRVVGINQAIQLLPDSAKNQVSDGYHTFGELYQHRCLLYILWANMLGIAWKSHNHHDGTSYDGWFISGLDLNGRQISYHLPIDLWDALQAEELERAPEWDGHTSQDVVARMRNWLGVSSKP